MVKQPAMEPSEFTMSHEDFPALPGVPASSAAAALNSNVVGSQQAGGITNAIGDTVSFIYGHSLRKGFTSLTPQSNTNFYPNITSLLNLTF